MSKPRTDTGEKNLIAKRLRLLREKHNLSQADLAGALQRAGVNVGKNVVTRIETQKRYVNDIE